MTCIQANSSTAPHVVTSLTLQFHISHLSPGVRPLSPTWVVPLACFVILTHCHLGIGVFVTDVVFVLSILLTINSDSGFCVGGNKVVFELSSEMLMCDKV